MAGGIEQNKQPPGIQQETNPTHTGMVIPNIYLNSACTKVKIDSALQFLLHKPVRISRAISQGSPVKKTKGRANELRD